MSTKIVPINYTSREFNSIKADLMEYARRYYPDTFQDFNEASFGALMVDTVAYIGDVLSFYIDYQVNESFLDTAVEFNNVMRIGHQLGYKRQGNPSSFGETSLYLLVPANATGLGPDVDYLPIVKAGSPMTSTSGGKFVLTEDIDFSNSSVEVVVGKVNKQTGIPTHYAIKTTAKIASGAFRKVKKTIGAHEKFKRVRVGNKSITEIVSVKDSEGNSYFEVEHLSQNTIYVPIVNNNADKREVTSILKPILVPRRYTVKRTGNSLFLQFGYGSESELTSRSVKDPRNVVMNMHAREYITDKEFDPSKLVKTDKFGICPSNTALSITYRINSPSKTATAANTIRASKAMTFRFRKAHTLSASKMSEVRNSIDASNEMAISSAAPETSSSDMKRRILGHFATQNRAVTKQDYLSLCYTMPGRFGSIKRANIVQDADSFKRNLNLYVIGENINTHLSPLTATAKTNLKIWLNQNRMVNDTIDIFDAKVVNYGIQYTVKAIPGADKNAILSRCNRLLGSTFAGRWNVLDISEPLYISKIYTILNRLTGVLDVKSVKIIPKEGTLYSSVAFDFTDRKAADGTHISVPENVILELKYPNLDIEGTVK